MVQPDSKMPTDIKKGSRANIPDLSRQFYGAQIRNFGMIMANGGVATLTRLALPGEGGQDCHMMPISYKRYRFPPDIIRHAIWLFARFTLSFRDVEELLAERGIDVSNETLRCWFPKCGRPLAANLRKARPRPSDLAP